MLLLRRQVVSQDLSSLENDAIVLRDFFDDFVDDVPPSDALLIE